MISRHEYTYLQSVRELLTFVLDTVEPSDQVNMTVPVYELLRRNDEWLDRLRDIGANQQPWWPERRLVLASEVMGPQMGVVQTNEALVDQMGIMTEAIKAATVKGPPASVPFG